MVVFFRLGLSNPAKFARITQLKTELFLAAFASNMYKPNFSITNNLLTYIARIESARTMIANAPLVPSWEAKFKSDAQTNMIHFGTKIEGNDLTQDQAAQVVKMSGIQTPSQMLEETGILARDRDVQEVINYRNVINWIDNWQRYVSNSSKFSPDILKTLHSICTKKIIEDNYVGEYRDKQVIVKSALDGEVAFRPPVSVEIPFLVDEFFEWLNHVDTVERVHPVFRAAITHYRLVYIHPFIEGNGRTARAMATLVLYEADYDFKKFFSIEQYFDNDVQAYYQALLSVQQHQENDMTYWLEYFCYGLAIELEKTKNKVMKLSKDLKMQKELGQQVALSERQILILESLQNQGQLTSKDAQTILPNVSVDTILRDLKDLIDKGVVVKHGVTKGVSYTLKD